jgi:integration host factor subunit beta
MVKSELIERIAHKQQMLTLNDVELGVKHILDYIVEQLSKGNRIEIRGFGTFCLNYRPSHEAHNPQTGERMAILAHHLPHFRVSKELKIRINQPDQPPLVENKANEDDPTDDAF